ncbi:MAG TPA: hypothetical protein DD670_17700 [Planctomycetaceae bacterium]|nr:hypothetical protein [Planctomycetaceae bacterium]
MLYWPHFEAKESDLDTGLEIATIRSLSGASTEACPGRLGRFRPFRLGRHLFAQVSAHHV